MAEESAQTGGEAPKSIPLEVARPADACLDWRVAQALRRTRGVLAHINRELPMLREGMHARRAADVFYDHACGAGEAPTEIFHVIELGVSLGLYARHFLDRLRQRSQAEGDPDIYSRVRFHATHPHAEHIRAVRDLGALEDHAERVHFARCDPREPHLLEDLDGDDEPTELAGRVHAFLHNHLLSQLPFDILWRRDGAWHELRITTLLTDLPRLTFATPLTLNALRTLAARGDDDALPLLGPVYDHFRLRRVFFPVEAVDLPLGRALKRFAEEEAGDELRVASPHGALFSLDAMVDALHDHGLILFHDFGDDTPEAPLHTYHSFRSGAAMGLDFRLLDAYALRLRGEPLHLSADDPGGLHRVHTRLLSREPLPEAHEAFSRHVQRASFEHLDALVERARDATPDEPDAARDAWSEAHEAAPENPRVLAEWAHFELRVTRDHARAVELAERAIALDPISNADVWCDYGDALYELGAHAKAHAAFSRAVELNPEHPRAHFNHAWTRFERSDFTGALCSCGLALAADHRRGLYQKRILSLQAQILETQAEKREASRARFQERYET